MTKSNAFKILSILLAIGLSASAWGQIRRRNPNAQYIPPSPWGPNPRDGLHDTNSTSPIYSPSYNDLCPEICYCTFTPPVPYPIMATYVYVWAVCSDDINRLARCKSDYSNQLRNMNPAYPANMDISSYINCTVPGPMAP